MGARNEGPSLWRRLLPGIILGVVLGLPIGAAVYTLLDREMKEKWSRVPFGVTVGILSSLTTTGIMYFLVQHHIRRREREVDETIGAIIAEVEDALVSLGSNYSNQDHEMSGRWEGLQWVLNYHSKEVDQRPKISRSDLPSMLFRIRIVPRIFAAGLSDISVVDRLLFLVTVLMNAGSPRIAKSIPRLIDQLSFDLRGVRASLEAGVRAFDALEHAASPARSVDATDFEISEDLNLVSDGADALCGELHEIADRFSNTWLKECLDRSWNRHAVQSYERTIAQFDEVIGRKSIAASPSPVLSHSEKRAVHQDQAQDPP